ncbi:protein farnesyltransferase subunit beta [Onthophagus taurus]|uniref:protein farnesyltransferase subunit beta n=1 Tax=Onthophagus taurus TaxID=166361 RepID=UPI0039BE44C1
MALRLRDFENLEKYKVNVENFPTTTSDEQAAVESNVERLFLSLGKKCALDRNLPKLLRNEHEKFLRQSLAYLSAGYTVIDASRTWMCYWILHALSLLEVQLSDTQLNSVVKFIEKCKHPGGGFGGGPGQLGHLATTYAAVNALCTIGTKVAYDTIDRNKLEEFLWSVRTPEGAFIMHRDGEVDIRGVYCALAVAHLTNIASSKLFEGTAEWIISCQTYEGGFAGAPGLEAHGGYTFCGIAALVLLDKAHLCDVKSLLRWVVNKQMKYEGGFQGRTNKLVDGCYSFWQAGIFPIISRILKDDNQEPDDLLFNRGALQEYILICCQYFDGGLIDKPGQYRDAYHTCYTLSGLSISQHTFTHEVYVLGSASNKLERTNPVFNICNHAVRKAILYFSDEQKVIEVKEIVENT